MSPTRVLYLSWESPWPAHSGGALRGWGLLTELCKVFAVDVVLLTRRPLTIDQTAVLGRLAQTVTRLPLPDVSIGQKTRIAIEMARRGYPYHSAVLEVALRDHPDVRRRILDFPGVVFTSGGHWGSLVYVRSASNWILNQCDADVEFWRVYASQATYPLARFAARVNYKLARSHYPRIYANVGRIISVCEEDRQYTLKLAPQARVDIIENGVDCSYYVPNRRERTGPLRLLFTGTSAPRNMTALYGFVRDVWPLVRAQMPKVEFLVGGNFSESAQAEFAGIPNMRFTGRVDDIRPVFDQGDVFVAPFEETHGSKLKIAEAMAMGLPIVSTPEGVRGFPVSPGTNVLIAEDTQAFARHCTELLRDPQLRQRIGEAARQTALERLDWSVLGQRLRHIVEQVAADIGCDT